MSWGEKRREKNKRMLIFLHMVKKKKKKKKRGSYIVKLEILGFLLGCFTDK